MKIIQEFIDKGLIKKDDHIDSSQVRSVLKKSQRSIKSARILIDDDRESSYQLAYEAMLLIGRALVLFLQSFVLRLERLRTIDN